MFMTERTIHLLFLGLAQDDSGEDRGTFDSLFCPTRRDVEYSLEKFRTFRRIEASVLSLSESIRISNCEFLLILQRN